MSMSVPFFRPSVTDDDIKSVTDCMRSGWLTSGPNVKKLEHAFAEAVDARYAVAVNSATSAAMLLLQQALDTESGRHRSVPASVVVPTWTFSGPAMMAAQLNADVVVCDVDDETLHLDPNSVMSRVRSNRQLVVMPTHFAGAACDMAPFDSMGVVIEDAAHAFPTKYRDGRMVGSNGTMATFFSFYATKTLTTGEGGMIVTSHADVAEKARASRLHGFNRPIEDRYTNLRTGWEYDIAGPGWKFNMPDMLAAFGLSRLKRAQADLEARRRIALMYNDSLQLIARTPVYDAWHAWHLYYLRVHDRDQFIHRMAEKGVQCSVHFKPLHLHSYWRARIGHIRLPVAEKAYEEVVSLPLFPDMTDAEIDYVIQSAKECL